MTNSKNSFFVIVAVILAMAAVLVVRSRPGKNVAGQNTLAPEQPVPALPSKNISAPGDQAIVSPAVEKPGLNMADLIARLRAGQEESDPEAKAGLEEQWEAMLTDANAAEILRALPPDLLATPFAEAALRRWVNADRKSAAGWVAQQSGLTESEQTSVIYGWGTRDKAALDDYLNELPTGEWKQSAMRFAANDALAGGSPKAALELLVQMDRTPARDDLFGWSATAWAQSDSATALQWANGLQDTVMKQKALGAVAVGLAWSDPQAAGQLLAQQVEPGEVLDQSALSVVCVWSQSDPPAAANWVAAFPEGKLQQTVLETLIQRWAAQDLNAVKNWVDGLPSGVLRIEAAKLYTAVADNLEHTETVRDAADQ